MKYIFSVVISQLQGTPVWRSSERSRDYHRKSLNSHEKFNNEKISKSQVCFPSLRAAMVFRTDCRKFFLRLPLLVGLRCGLEACRWQGPGQTQEEFSKLPPVSSLQVELCKCNLAAASKPHSLSALPSPTTTLCAKTASSLTSRGGRCLLFLNDAMF